MILFFVETLRILAGSVEYSDSLIKISKDNDKSISITLFSKEDEKTMNADNIEISLTKKNEIEKVIAEGSVTIKYKDMQLKGDTCTYMANHSAYNKKGGIVNCVGNVLLKDLKKNESIKGHTGTFDLNTNTYSIKSGSTQERVEATLQSKK